jgi:predicted acyltransferase
MVRHRSIDAFRGFAILGMIFFTVTLRLSSDLPDSLRHNVWGSIHLGDFILPMFLFASGLSLAYFLRKREKEERKVFWVDVIKRFAKLAFVGVSLSFFSAYGFLEMDEVMLCALLFIVCVALSRLDWKIVLGIIFFINLSYIFLMQLNQVDIFIGHYLGGYPATLYYLPVMLTGLTIGKGIISEKLWCEKNKIFVVMIFIFFILFRVFIPINKMTVSPPFIMLSILFSFLVFAVIEIVLCNIGVMNKLENMGRKPLRYWVMLYIVFIIPLWFYVEFSRQTLPLQIYWPIGIVISLGLMLFLWSTFHITNYINVSN